MILLFLGSWRSTIIVMASIPLSILVSIIILWFLGETLNVMTLGGMALAVGILVDDATVEIENIHRNLHQKKRLVQAILDGAQQIAVPAFVSTLCICIVFVPVVFISGAAKFLFTPLAMAVVFAMMASYLLSRTLIPTLVHYLLAAEVELYGGVIDTTDPHAVHALHAKEAIRCGQPIPDEDKCPWDRITCFFRSPAGIIVLIGLVLLLTAAIVAIADERVGHAIPVLAGTRAVLRSFFIAHWRVLAEIILAIAAVIPLCWLVLQFHGTFNRVFEVLRLAYGGLLDWALAHRLAVVTAFLLLVGLSCGLFPILGTDFFPTVDAGQIRLHVRARPAHASKKPPRNTPGSKTPFAARSLATKLPRCSTTWAFPTAASTCPSAMAPSCLQPTAKFSSR